MWLTALRTLERIGELGAAAGVTFCVENLNTIVDHPGVPLARAKDTLALVEAVGHPNVRMMLDLYHAQIGEGNLIELIRRCGDAIGEMQVADVPGRCEPGTGEINYPAIAKALRDIGFTGTVGLEAWASRRQHCRARSVSQRVQLIVRDEKLAIDKGGVEVVARRAVTMRPELDGGAGVVERRPRHRQQRRAWLLVEQLGLRPSRSARADALAGQPDVHAAGAQRLIEPVALEFLGIGRDVDRQVVSHHGQRLAVGTAQPVDRHDFTVLRSG